MSGTIVKIVQNISHFGREQNCYKMKVSVCEWYNRTNSVEDFKHCSSTNSLIQTMIWNLSGTMVQTVQNVSNICLVQIYYKILVETCVVQLYQQYKVFLSLV